MKSSSPPIAEVQDQLARLGYVMLPAVFAADSVVAIRNRLVAALNASTASCILRSRGSVYGCRNLGEVFPDLNELLQAQVLREFLVSALGPGVGLVRTLYFDKPPGRSWSLAWHRDETIAVRRHVAGVRGFDKPTIKAGIPHLEAPHSLLANMLTLRVHLDAMTADNGPLSVIPASHLGGDSDAMQPVALHAVAGDVLAMRPLLVHSSSESREGLPSHRRIVHLEFASTPELPGGLEWHAFQPLQ